MKRVLFSVILLAIISIGTTSYKPLKKEKIHWLTIEEMQTAYAKKPKPILIDVYTSWCGWCKVMDRETYSDDKVAAYINETYYAIKFDAESKDTYKWNNKTCEYNAANKANDLAVLLLYGQMSYPATIFLSTIDAQPAPLHGYLKPSEIEAPIKFFGSGAYKTKKYPEFMSSFTVSW